MKHTFKANEAPRALVEALLTDGVIVDDDPILRTALTEVAVYLRLAFRNATVTWYGTAREEGSFPDEIVAAYALAEDEGKGINRIASWRYDDWLGFNLETHDNRLWLTWSIMDSGVSGVSDYMLIGGE